MNYPLALYLATCFMQFIILINITLFNSQWDGITMWLCTGIFIFSTAVFVSSKSNKRRSSNE
ncbi:hypothetical protein [Lysinibacillus xylanilyticus]|uniref:Uncharacterized protein n=1 Tax=Lysinibacillus xylanilyticus TaxID=582475 RepID=A0A2M9QAC8_9BACI|nr:hypothetical protein [Lysinibacillus xylanilyticus]PJO45027.1 hypothetical protein CWD94_03085 [Lysinibacillus xylanilyticus]